MQNSYRKTLSNSNFCLLWIGQIISQFGDRLTQMALIGLAYQLNPGSTISLAKKMTLAIIPVFLVGPFAGVYVDRWDKRKTMYISDLLRVILIMLIPIVSLHSKSLIPIYILIFLSFCCGRFFIPAKMAIIPSLVSKDQSLIANSLISLTGMIAAVLGFGFGGIIVEKWGVANAFLIDAATFFISFFCILAINIPDHTKFDAQEFIQLSKQVLKKVKSSMLSEINQGFKYIVKSPETKFAVKIMSVLFAAIGSLYIIFIVFIQQTLNTITLDLGWLAGFSGIGLFIGSVIYGKVGNKLNIKKIINWSLFISSLHLLMFCSIMRYFLPHKLFAGISCFLLGIFCAPIVIAVNTLIHNESNDYFWGRIFSSLEIIIHLAFLGFMLTASFLAEKTTPFTIIIITGILLALFSLTQIILEHNKRNDNNTRI
jgi:MFS family permease